MRAEAALTDLESAMGTTPLLPNLAGIPNSCNHQYLLSMPELSQIFCQYPQQDAATAQQGMLHNMIATATIRNCNHHHGYLLARLMGTY